MSSTLTVATLLVAGLFSIGLGVVHLAIPRLLDFPGAIGVDGPGMAPLATRALGSRTYLLRRRDVLGISWVMSNAASYVLLSIGLVDLGWAAGWRGLPVLGGALWVFGWWVIRAGGQFVIGRRCLDIAFAAWFAALGLVHLALGVGWLAT